MRDLEDLQERLRDVNLSAVAKIAGVERVTLARIRDGKNAPTWNTYKRVVAAYDLFMADMAARAKSKR